MAGVWVFNNGVTRLVQNPYVENVERRDVQPGRRKVLIYRPSNQVISSYGELEPKLLSLGWSRYPNEQPGNIQYHKGYSSNLLITLPRDFRSLKPMHMLDIAMKNRDHFEVRDQ